MFAFTDRELASRQERAAASFQEVIRCSITTDCDVNVISREVLEGSTVSLSNPAAASVSDSKQKLVTGATAFRTGSASSNTSAGLETVDCHHNDNDGTKLDDKNKASPAEEQSNSAAHIVGAACDLTSDLCRLALRQGDDALQLLNATHNDGEEPTSRGRSCDVRGDLATLGKSVALQARAVGLMEEVVIRTDRLRVRIAGLRDYADAYDVIIQMLVRENREE